MDLLATTRTLKLFDLENIKVLHLEPTTVCNASCPQCNRENPNYYKEELNKSDLTLEQCQNLFSIDFVKKLDKMFMCGNFGEPAAARDVVKIYKYFKDHNPTITLGMNTNGSIRSTAWWTELAAVFSNPLDYVVFSIDGLEDTNHIYRRNTNWTKIIENAQAFINAGGTAHWDMLVYSYNEHQVEAAQALAYDLGFSWFRAKVSKRFSAAPVTFLKPPKNYKLPNVNVSETTATINCHAVNEKSIYVAADGQILPCCWFGAEAFTLDNKAKELLSDWNGKLVPSWQNDVHRICQNTCADDNIGTSFSKQWQIEKQLR